MTTLPKIFIPVTQNTFIFLTNGLKRSRWLSGRFDIEGLLVQDLQVALHLCPCTGSNKEDRKLSRHDLKVVQWDVKHTHKQTKPMDFSIKFDTIK